MRTKSCGARVCQVCQIAGSTHGEGEGEGDIMCVGEVVRSAEDKRLTESQLLEMLGLESIQSLIRKRKLQWVAHCARRGEEDLSWKRIVREVEDGKSKWGTRLKEDWKELGVNTVRGWCNKVKDRGWLASKLGTSKKKGRAKKKG